MKKTLEEAREKITRVIDSIQESPRDYCKAYSKKAIKIALLLLEGGATV